MVLGKKWVNGKEMRRGYTTGSCAAAAAKGAVQMLFSQKSLDRVGIMTLAGIPLDLQLYNILIEPDKACCSIQKDAGDDPDVTHGIHIFAQAKKTPSGIDLKGGKGVGLVTKPGLVVKVGNPAINPGAKKMIIQEVEKVLPKDAGVEITFFIPDGEAIAQKTFNPRLGIMGGLSILGTTGIVEPMSEEAWKESLRLELKVLREQGQKKFIMVFGNYGENYAKNHLQLWNIPLVKFSNYVGYGLKAAADLGFEEILLLGDIGKLIKVAAGIFNTHSHVADARMEIVAAYAASLGASKEIIKEILALNTTVAAIELLEKENLMDIFPVLARRVSERAMQHINDSVLIGTVLFTNSDKRLLAIDENGKKMLERYKNE